MRPGIYRRGEIDDYDRIKAVNISSLCWIAKSPKHYKCRPRKSTKAMSLGTAAHAATLEPERFQTDFAAWSDRSSNGNMAARRGAAWEAFCALHSGQTIITQDEYVDALEIANAVRRDELCAEVLATGQPEVALVWVHEGTGILCKGRVDWLDIDGGRALFADLKTAADIEPGPFLNKAAKLHYHTRMAWYHDAIKQLSGMGEDDTLETLILAVESGKPHDAACYWMPEEALDAGRAEYEDWMSRLKSAQAFDNWHGIAACSRIKYTLPRWAVDDPEDEPIADLQLDWSK
jgi:hypothetical protein